MNSEIIRKLKLDGYANRLILNKPSDVDDFDGLSFDTTVVKPQYNLILAFIFSLDEFTFMVNQVIDKDMLYPNGYLYFVYPKKGNKQYKEYIGRDDFFTPVLMDENGFVNGSLIKFNRMVAFDNVFTCIGLKHITETKGGTKPSQCVSDYIDRIPDLQKYFAENQPVLDLFNKLTPGYRRDWARYVYSAQTATTVIKRLTEMENILKEGYKSKDLYRQGKK